MQSQDDNKKPAWRLALNAGFIAIAYAMIDPRCPPEASNSKWGIEPKKLQTHRKTGLGESSMLEWLSFGSHRTAACLRTQLVDSKFRGYQAQ